jgi:hypothetical protein
VVELYARLRDGNGGYSCLPDAGGFNDQCGWLMDAFEIIQAAAEKLEKDG